MTDKPALRDPTPARIRLGRTGVSIRTQDQLAFQLDHAAARDAVHTRLDTTTLLAGLRERNWPTLPILHSTCEDGKERDRRPYLQRPDLGRRLSPASVPLLQRSNPDLAFILVDGLSALAIERHALPFLDAWHALDPTKNPVAIVRNGRVAIGDEIGALIHAAMTVVLIGERPGLTAPDSMGLYLTMNPHPGRTDAERNCISNIRLGGLSYADAASRLRSLIQAAQLTGRTGVLPAGTSPPLLNG